jgi:hypothetical protein
MEAPNTTISSNNLEVLFIHEDVAQLSKIFRVNFGTFKTDKVTLETKNIEAIQTIQTICNVLVVLFYEDILYFVGMVKIINENQAMLTQGATFNFPAKLLLSKCKNIELLNLLARIYEKKFEFTPDEKFRFIQLSCQSKNFPNILIRSNSCPLLYFNDENEIIKVESPIVKLIP